MSSSSSGDFLFPRTSRTATTPITTVAVKAPRRRTRQLHQRQPKQPIRSSSVTRLGRCGLFLAGFHSQRKGVVLLPMRALRRVVPHVVRLRHCHLRIFSRVMRRVMSRVMPLLRVF